MLCISMSPGDYLTIGENVVLQMDRVTGSHCKVTVNAPREIPVVRGEVRERAGAQRPACLTEKPRWKTPELPWDQSKAQALAAMRRVLSQMDGGDANVQTLRRQLEHIFPPKAGQPASAAK